MREAGQLESARAGPALDKFLVGFEGTSPPDELRALLAQGLAGVALFPRNFSSLQGLRTLTEELQSAAGRTILIAIDQEGGRRFSLPEPFTPWPSATELGILDDTGMVEQMARALGTELRAAGCNLDFAPMLDLAINPESPVTSGRSFGADPQKAARLGAAFLRGLASAGVLACAKHFPGHGDTQVDPHEDLPVFHGDPPRLNRVELVPFVEAITAGVHVIMTAHILLPQFDPATPASLSRMMLVGLLRQRLRFSGIILADDLGMGAIRKRREPGAAAVEAFRAGSDMALLCHDWPSVRPAITTVENALAQGLIDEGEWKASHTRIERLRTRAAEAWHEAPPLEVVGCAEYRALAAEIRAQVVKAVGG